MNPFFAYLNRLKLIRRWGLMRNTIPENDMEHSMQCALIAHGLAVLARERHGKDVNPETVLAYALYHDVGEVITGDLPTPVKHNNPVIRDEYHRLEAIADQRLLRMLPEDIRPTYETLIGTEEKGVEWRIVKAADKISAYIKCMEERKMGNREFAEAETSTLSAIRRIDLPEVQDFMDDFVPGFGMSLDEISRD